MSRLQAVLEAGRAHRASNGAKTGTRANMNMDAMRRSVNEMDREAVDERRRSVVEQFRAERERVRERQMDWGDALQQLRIQDPNQLPEDCMTVSIPQLTFRPDFPPGRYRLTPELVRFLADGPPHIYNYGLNMDNPRRPYFEIDEREDFTSFTRASGPRRRGHPNAQGNRNDPWHSHNYGLYPDEPDSAGNGYQPRYPYDQPAPAYEEEDPADLYS